VARRAPLPTGVSASLYRSVMEMTRANDAFPTREQFATLGVRSERAIKEIERVALERGDVVRGRRTRAGRYESDGALGFSPGSENSIYPSDRLAGEESVVLRKDGKVVRRREKGKFAKGNRTPQELEDAVDKIFRENRERLDKETEVYQVDFQNRRLERRLDVHGRASDRGDVDPVDVDIERVDTPGGVVGVSSEVFRVSRSARDANKSPWVVRNSAGGIEKFFASKSKAQSWLNEKQKGFGFYVDGRLKGQFRTRPEANRARAAWEASEGKAQAESSIPAGTRGRAAKVKKAVKDRWSIDPENVSELSKPERLGDGYVIREYEVSEDGSFRSSKPVEFHTTLEGARSAKERRDRERVGREAAGGELLSPGDAQFIQQVRDPEVGPGAALASKKEALVSGLEQKRLARQEARETLTPEQKEAFSSLEQRLGSILKSQGLDQRVLLKLVKGLSVTEDGRTPADFTSAARLIQIAADPGFEAKDLDSKVAALRPYLNHETFHALSQMDVISASERKELTRYAEKTPVPKRLLPQRRAEFEEKLKALLDEGQMSRENFDKSMRRASEVFRPGVTYMDIARALYSRRTIGDRGVAEEAFAMASEDYDRTRNPSPAGKPVNKVARFMTRLGRAVRGRNKETAEEIFEKLYGGEFGDRVREGKILDTWWIDNMGSPEFAELEAWSNAQGRGLPFGNLQDRIRPRVEAEPEEAEQARIRREEGERARTGRPAARDATRRAGGEEKEWGPVPWKMGRKEYLREMGVPGSLWDVDPKNDYWGGMLEEEWHDARADARKHEKVWDESALRAFLDGRLASDDVPRVRRESMVDSDLWDRAEPLPGKLYHVTTNGRSVREYGLLTSGEMEESGIADSAAGLGGSTSGLISFTESEDVASAIEDFFKEAIAVAKNEKTVEDILAEADSGEGADRPWINELVRDDEKIDRLRRGVRLETKMSGIREAELPDGARGVGSPSTASNGEAVYHAYELPLSKEEMDEERWQLFKNSSAHRQATGGQMYPLLWGGGTASVARFASLDPQSVETFEFRPRGAGITIGGRRPKGVRFAGLGEWRTSASAVEPYKESDYQEETVPPSEVWVQGPNNTFFSTRRAGGEVFNRAYFDAVNSGDMDLAQMMIDAAAKAEGYEKRGNVYVPKEAAKEDLGRSEPSDPVVYDESGNIVPITQRFYRDSAARRMAGGDPNVTTGDPASIEIEDPLFWREEHASRLPTDRDELESLRQLANEILTFIHAPLWRTPYDKDRLKDDILWRLTDEGSESVPEEPAVVYVGEVGEQNPIGVAVWPSGKVEEFEGNDYASDQSQSIAEDLIKESRAQNVYEPATRQAGGDVMKVASALDGKSPKQVVKILKKYPASIIANGFAEGFTDQGQVNLLGQRLKGAMDLAVLGQVYRNPGFETFRVFYTRDWHVVGQTATTSRIPNIVVIESKEEKITDYIREDMERLGANGFWLLHNHPSADPLPSDMDERLTVRLYKETKDLFPTIHPSGESGSLTTGRALDSGTGFLGHVVVNQDRYGYINHRGDSWADALSEKRDIPETYDATQPSVPHELLNRKIKVPKDLAKIGSELAHDQNDYFQIVSHSRAGISGIMDVPNELLEELSFARDSADTTIGDTPRPYTGSLRLAAVLRRFLNQTGGAQLFAMNVNPAQKKLFQSPIARYAFTDIVTTDGETLLDRPGGKLNFGQTIKSIRSPSVFSDWALSTPPPKRFAGGDVRPDQPIVFEGSLDRPHELPSGITEFILNKVVGRSEMENFRRSPTTGFVSEIMRLYEERVRKGIYVERGDWGNEGEPMYARRPPRVIGVGEPGESHEEIAHRLRGEIGPLPGIVSDSIIARNRDNTEPHHEEAPEPVLIVPYDGTGDAPDAYTNGYISRRIDVYDPERWGEDARSAPYTIERPIIAAVSDLWDMAWAATRKAGGSLADADLLPTLQSSGVGVEPDFFWGQVPSGGKKGPGRRGTPVVVQSGNYGEDPVTGQTLGYGAARMDRNEEGIQQNTPYTSWKELLPAFLERLGNARVGPGSAEIVPDGPIDQDKVRYIWKADGWKKPAVITMRRGDFDGRKVWSAENVYSSGNIYADPEFAYQSEGGVPRWGNEASADAVRIALRPELFPLQKQQSVRGRKSRLPQMATRQAAGVFPEGMSSAERTAQQQIMGPNVPRKTFFEATLGTLKSIDSDWMQRVSRQLFDKYERIYHIGQDAIDRRIAARHLASTTAHSNALNIDNAHAYVASMMDTGGITNQFGVTMVDPLDLENTIPAGSVVVGVNDDGSLRMNEEAINAGKYSDSGGLMQILAPLVRGNLDDTLWAYEKAVRAQRLRGDGRRVSFTDTPGQTDDLIRQAIETAQKYPEVLAAHHNLQRWNNMTLDFLETAGFPPELIRSWKKHNDYIPFYLDNDPEVVEAFKNVVKADIGDNRSWTAIDRILTGIPGKKLKGGKGAYPMLDPMEAITKNATMLVTAGLKNIATNMALDDASAVQDASGVALAEQTDKKDPESIRVFRGGEEQYWKVEDPLLHATLTGVFRPKDQSFQQVEDVLGRPARWLRESVTRSPEFMLANMMRDSLAVWAQGGDVGMPILGTLSTFSQQIATGPETFTTAGGTEINPVRILERTGTIGGYEFSRVEKGTLNRKMRRAMGINPTNGVSGLPMALWDKAGEWSSVAEAATRQRVFENVFNQVYGELGNLGEDERVRRAIGEAAHQAREILNFNRKGANPFIQLASIAIPFLNARIQGLHRLGRAFTRGELVGETIDPKKASVVALRRGAAIAGATVGYTLLFGDDDELDKIRPEVRDDYWLLPLFGEEFKYFALPIPFEIGILFKVIPEHFTRQLMGEATTRESLDSLNHALFSTMNVSLPALIKPLSENIVNYNMFTGEHIIPFYMEGWGGNAYRPTTSETLKMVGRATDISPLKWENMIRGHLGQLGMYGLSVVDAGLQVTGMTQFDKPSPRMTDFPFFRRFLQDNYESGLASTFYALREETDAIVAQVNQFKKTDPERAVAMQQENVEMLAIRDYINQTERYLEKIRDQEIAVYTSPGLSPGEKRELMDALADQKNMVLQTAPMMASLVDDGF